MTEEELRTLWDSFATRWKAGERDEVVLDIMCSTTTKMIKDAGRWFTDRYFMRGQLGFSLMNEVREYLEPKIWEEKERLREIARKRREALAAQYQPSTNEVGVIVK